MYQNMEELTKTPRIVQKVTPKRRIVRLITLIRRIFSGNPDCLPEFAKYNVHSACNYRKFSIFAQIIEG